MRITTVIGGLSGGGAERVCVNLANAWAARGHRVTILTVAQRSAPPAYAIDPRVERRDVGWPRSAHADELNIVAIAPIVRGLNRAGCTALLEQLALMAMLRHAILPTDPAVVVSHLDLTNLRVLAAMQETSVPIIACEHTDATRISLGQWQSTRAALYRHARAVVASHPTIAEWFAQHGAAALAIPNPLVAPPPVRVERNGDRQRIVALARLSQEKRVDLLIRAFARLAGDFPDWDLDIYGTGPQHGHLARLIDQLSPGRAHLRGFTTSPYMALAGADLFASTSWIEGFGNAIWEALACGVPVVAMEGGAPVRALVRDGVDGLIVPTDSALVPALASLMGDEAARKTMAARAPEVLTRFSIESSLAAWDALLDRVAVAGRS